MTRKNKPAHPVDRERRASPRIPAEQAIPDAVMRLAAGQEVELININLDGGLLIKSDTMLKPGSYVRLRLDIAGESTTVGGCVRRCRIATIKNSKIYYEAAIILNEKFPLPLNTDLISPAHPLQAELFVEDPTTAS